MIQLVQVLPLDYQVVKDSELTELFVHVSTKCDSIDQLLNDSNLEIELKITDGDTSFCGYLKREDITKAKHQKNTQTDKEWNTLLIQALFNQIPISYIDTVEISGKELVRDGAAVVEIELKTKIGPSIYQSLGILEFKRLDDDSINYADHLFEWSRLMSDYNKRLQKEIVKTRAQTDSLKKEMQEMNKFQKDLVEESKFKDKVQLKIMTKLLNAKKHHYEQLSNGEIDDDRDDFNTIAIRNIKDEVIQQEEDIKPKVKKRKTTTGKKQPRGLKAAQFFRKKNAAKEFANVKSEDEDEFIPETNNEDETGKSKDQEAGEVGVIEKPTTVKDDPQTKAEPEIPQAVKAETEASVHFQFSDVNAKNENNKNENQAIDGDETIEEDENITEVDETEDDTEDDTEMAVNNQSDAATVTDTDTDSGLDS